MMGNTVANICEDGRSCGMAKPAEQLVLPCLFWLLFLTKKKSDKDLNEN
jgi:hypothetical protein